VCGAYDTGVPLVRGERVRSQPEHRGRVISSQRRQARRRNFRFWGDRMECSYAIDTQEQLVRIKVWGELTATGLIELMNRAGADPDFVAGMPAIADYREAH